MGLSCGARLLKFLLFIFNLLFMLCGIVCVCIGIFMVLNRYAVENLASAALRSESKSDALMDMATKPSTIRQIGYAFIIIGFIVLLVAFMGCCGAVKELRPLLCCYATLLMVILAIELSFAIYAAMHTNSFKKDLRQLLQESIKMYNGTDVKHYRNEYKDETITTKVAWDMFMIDKKCCGIDSNKNDFLESPWYKTSGKTHNFPAACCPLRKNGQLMPFCPTISRYGEGCYKKITESLSEVSGNFKIIMIVSGFISAIQAFGIIVAFCLCNAISGCIEFYQFEKDFRLSLLYGIIALLAVIEIVCFATAIRLFILIKVELLYLYD